MLLPSVSFGHQVCWRSIQPNMKTLLKLILLSLYDWRLNQLLNFYTRFKINLVWNKLPRSILWGVFFIKKINKKEEKNVDYVFVLCCSLVLAVVLVLWSHMKDSCCELTAWLPAICCSARRFLCHPVHQYPSCICQTLSGFFLSFFWGGGGRGGAAAAELWHEFERSDMCLCSLLFLFVFRRVVPLKNTSKRSPEEWQLIWSFVTHYRASQIQAMLGKKTKKSFMEDIYIPTKKIKIQGDICATQMLTKVPQRQQWGSLALTHRQERTMKCLIATQVAEKSVKRLIFF